eukprot:gb/GECH01002549.1/.p1 GENE.gb/GECH01002549.1/~~gb/GECH01002549.1/.p1  ORF type:complete len:332 (+),score=86.87 gb/GECH01002549.1/:1-996(+)
MTKQVESGPIPWVEKYRPKTVNDVVYQEEAVSALKNCIKLGTMPHLLFYGPAGTGKTSTILAMAKELYGDMYKNRVLELNASDERGINVVRTKIKQFASFSVTSGKIGFKLIVLDEADAMTPEAQAALRRTMETYSSITRFCLLCNYVSRIIDPIASRCAKFRFRPLPMECIEARLEHVSQVEGVDLGDGAMQALIEYSGGDLRRAVTLLQSSWRAGAGTKVSATDVRELAGAVHPQVLDDLVSASSSNNFETLQSCVHNIVCEGYPASLVLSKLHDQVIAMDTSKISDVGKAAVCMRIADSDKKLSDGADEYLVLLSAASTLMRVFTNNK